MRLGLRLSSENIKSRFTDGLTEKEIILERDDGVIQCIRLALALHYATHNK